MIKSNSAQIFLVTGAAIFFILGSVHGILTVRDLSRPRAFTPTDDSVRRAMVSARLALNPRANLWLVWLGFSLSHSLGLLVFGGGLLALSIQNFGFFAESLTLEVTSVAVAAAYFALSIRFWYWGPALITGVALGCLLAAVLLVRAA